MSLSLQIEFNANTCAKNIQTYATSMCTFTFTHKAPALQRQNTDISKQIFLEKE
jgi:hypothetical protein